MDGIKVEKRILRLFFISSLPVQCSTCRFDTFYHRHQNHIYYISLSFPLNEKREHHKMEAARENPENKSPELPPILVLSAVAMRVQEIYR